jgi:hypothetical protein
MKKVVKSTISFYRLLIEHSQRPYEPSPQHVLKRMLLPLCANFNTILSQGTKNDSWELLRGFAEECKSLRQADKQRRP